MEQFNCIYERDPDMFSDRKLRVNRKELVVIAEDIKDAIKQAYEHKPKGFYIVGVKPTWEYVDFCL